jgi:hypothetical protein
MKCHGQKAYMAAELTYETRRPPRLPHQHPSKMLAYGTARIVRTSGYLKLNSNRTFQQYDKF